MNKKQLEAKKKYYETFKNSVDYIQVYDNVISEEDCKYFINLHEDFKAEGIGNKGKVSADYTKNTPTVHDNEFKTSYDIYLNTLNEYLVKNNKKEEINSINSLYKTLNSYIADYLIKVGLMGNDFIGTGLKFFNKHREKMADGLNSMFYLRTVCLRKYDKMVGGYHAMHSDVSHRTITRCAAGILYLNTIEDGGETKFPVLDREIKPVKGRFVLFPPYYTHMHYGEISKKNDRYVVICHIVYNNVEVKLKKGE